MYAFVKHSSDNGSAQWKSGDAYALEFATIRLPVGYIFGSEYPTVVSDPIKSIKTKTFDPEQTGETLEFTIDVRALRPGKGGTMELQKVGDTETDATNI